MHRPLTYFLDFKGAVLKISSKNYVWFLWRLQSFVWRPEIFLFFSMKNWLFSIVGSLKSALLIYAADINSKKETVRAQPLKDRITTHEILLYFTQIKWLLLWIGHGTLWMQGHLKLCLLILKMSFLVPPHPPLIYDENGRRLDDEFGPILIGGKVVATCVSNGGQYAKRKFLQRRYYWWHFCVRFFAISAFSS